MKTGKYFRHVNFLITLAFSFIFLGQGLWLSSTLYARSADKPKQKQSLAKTKKKSARPVAPRPESLPWPQNLLTLVRDGAVLLVDTHAPQGRPRELYAHNAEKLYVPASILKIVTSEAALEFLGPDFRFKTDFLLTKTNDLWIVGYGDPYLVSEELVVIVRELQKRGLKEVRHLYIDDSYFEANLILDGNTQTRALYDAYNGAFSVNFNTVSFQKTKKGQVIRAAAHLPVTPLALKLAAQNKEGGTYQLNISESPEEAEFNAGETFKAHLEEAGIRMYGVIFTGHPAPEQRKIFYRHESSKTLEDLVRELIKYSNNFITNQIFLSLGAELYGPPATLVKSQQAMNFFFQRHGLKPITMGDGSGLSRQTTLTARQMAGILKVSEPDRYLLTPGDKGLILFKTGTMSDIKTMAGYLERPDNPGRPISFVILLNGPNYVGVRNRVLDILKNRFLSSPPSASGR